MEESVISDHSFISAELERQLDSDKRITKVAERRRWRNFNQDIFLNDLVHSQLIANPPSDAVSLCVCYDETSQ